MITADYLFDKKIIWLGDNLICSNNFSYFKEELITVLEALMAKEGIEDSFDAIKQMEDELTKEYQCLCYIRFFKKGRGYKMSFYSATSSADLEDAMSAYRDWVDGGFTSLKWSDVIGNTVDTEDIFNKLNESFDNTLIGKQIWFDFQTERNDIEKVNQFLIDNGYRGLRPDNIDEFEGFIYDYDVAFFYFVQHDSPLHSEERRKPYVDYSYMNHPDPYRLKAKPNWIYYKDILKMTDTTVDIMSNLNESTKQPTLKVGDFLLCHTDVIMVDDGSKEATENNMYPITDVKNDGVYIKNNSGDEHKFSTNPTEDWYYGIWFNLVPREYKEDLDNFNTEDIFNQLN